MTVTVRDARTADAGIVAGMIRLLAAEWDETSEVTTAYVEEYLAHVNVGALLAELDGTIAGLATYSLYPGLFHAGPWGLLDELIVRPEARRRGVADALVGEVLRRFEAAGCKEASVSTGMDNEPAKALYRKHGLTDESLLLERHFPPTPAPPRLTTP
jgi:ribosomal protein S18 acetylase RimI-like enzyme